MLISILCFRTYLRRIKYQLNIQCILTLRNFKLSNLIFRINLKLFHNAGLMPIFLMLICFNKWDAFISQYNRNSGIQSIKQLSLVFHEYINSSAIEFIFKLLSTFSCSIRIILCLFLVLRLHKLYYSIQYYKLCCFRFFIYWNGYFKFLLSISI